MKTSYYYKYNFVSPEPIFTEVKEELRSYFQTGVIDDVLFTRYTEDALKRLGRVSYKITENVFQLENFELKLPDNFEAVRELWLVTPHNRSFRLPNVCYEQATVRVTPEIDRCNIGDACAPKDFKITYKIQGKIIETFHCHHLLKPGNVHARENCSLDSLNFHSRAMETFDIINNKTKLTTNFPEGMLYMVYYIKDYDDNDYQLVPDNIRVKDYLKAYLKYKCFENIYNNISDETINQVQAKFQYYEAKMYEAKVLAESELVRQTAEQQIRAVKSARHRFNKYQIF